MAKSTDAFRTIGEVSDELDVPKHVLRFWEGKFPQLKPMKRGGGRRFYRPEDVTLLRGIHHLLHAAGYTIKGVQRILREQGVDVVKAVLDGGTIPVAPRGNPPSAAGGPASVAGRRPKRNGAATQPASLREQLLDLARELDAVLAVARGTSPHGVPPSSLKSTAKMKRA